MDWFVTWWSGHTSGQKVRIFLFFSTFVFGLITWPIFSLYNHFTHTATGEVCEDNGDCRSRICLTASDHEPTTTWSSMGLLPPEDGAELDRTWNEVFDPLAAGNESLREAGVTVKYCTEPCEEDGDCPVDMYCAETQGFRPSLLSGDDPDQMWVSDTGLPGMYCVHHEISQLPTVPSP